MEMSYEFGVFERNSLIVVVNEQSANFLARLSLQEGFEPCNYLFKRLIAYRATCLVRIEVKLVNGFEEQNCEVPFRET